MSKIGQTGCSWFGLDSLANNELGWYNSLEPYCDPTRFLYDKKGVIPILWNKYRILRIHSCHLATLQFKPPVGRHIWSSHDFLFLDAGGYENHTFSPFTDLLQLQYSSSALQFSQVVDKGILAFHTNLYTRTLFALYVFKCCPSLGHFSILNKEVWETELERTAHICGLKAYCRLCNPMVAYLGRTEWVCKILQGVRISSLLCTLLVGYNCLVSNEFNELDKPLWATGAAKIWFEAIIQWNGSKGFRK